MNFRRVLEQQNQLIVSQYPKLVQQMLDFQDSLCLSSHSFSVACELSAKQSLMTSISMVRESYLQQLEANMKKPIESLFGGQGNSLQLQAKNFPNLQEFEQFLTESIQPALKDCSSDPSLQKQFGLILCKVFEEIIKKLKHEVITDEELLSSVVEPINSYSEKNFSIWQLIKEMKIFCKRAKIDIQGQNLSLLFTEQRKRLLTPILTSLQKLSAAVLFSWYAEEGSFDHITSLRKIFELFMLNFYPKYSSKLLREEFLIETAKYLLELCHVLGSCLKVDYDPQPFYDLLLESFQLRSLDILNFHNSLVANSTLAMNKRVF